MNAPLHHFLDSLTLGEPACLGPITLVPLRSTDSAVLDLALIDDETARIGEVSDGGVVGRVRVESLTRKALLLVAGEILRGARQNRLVNSSLLIEPGGELEVPVSCVEQGRWAYRGGRGFQSAGATVPWHMRSRSVSRSLRAKRRRGRHDADQGTIWSEVDAHLRRKGRSSRTRDLVEGMDAQLHTAASAWSPGVADCGALFFIGKKLVGMEAFGSSKAWKAAHRRVLAGLCEEASGMPEDPPEQVDVLGGWRDRLKALSVVQTPGEGLGVELQAEDGTTHLAALVAALDDDDPSVVHLRVAELPEPVQPSGDQSASGRARRPRRRHAEPREPVSFEGRRMMRRMRPLQAALERPMVTVGGPCLVLPLTVLERARRLVGPGGVLHPHRTGGGLAVWRSGAIEVLSELGSALVEAGARPDQIWIWDGIHARLRGVPSWLQAESRGSLALLALEAT